MGWSRVLVILLWPVWNHSTTSFWGLSYIETVSLSPNTFSGLKISHMRLLIAFTSPLAGWGGRVEGVGWKGREREGEEHTKFRQGIHGWDITKGAGSYLAGMAVAIPILNVDGRRHTNKFSKIFKMLWILISKCNNFRYFCRYYSSSFKLFWDTNKCNEKLCKKK